MAKDKTHRKPTALVHADVKGYSRIMGEDDEYTVKTLASHRKEMYRLVWIRKGHVRDAAGDGFLVEFPSVVNAVGLSVELRRQDTTDVIPVRHLVLVTEADWNDTSLLFWRNNERRGIYLYRRVV